MKYALGFAGGLSIAGIALGTMRFYESATMSLFSLDPQIVVGISAAIVPATVMVLIPIWLRRHREYLS